MRRWTALLAMLVLVAGACGDDSADQSVVTTEAVTAETSPETTASTAAAQGPTPSGPVFISMGDSGAYVSALQYLLDCSGFGPLVADGMYGDITYGAVERAQAGQSREITGEPDEATFAELSRSCDRSQTIYFPPGTTSVELAGNVASGDFDEFVVGIVGGQLLTMEVSGPVSIAVQGRDGTVLYGPEKATETEIVIPLSQDYSVFVQADAPTSYLLSIDIPAPEGDVTTTEGDYVGVEFDPADWIGVQWSGDPPESLVDFGGSFACGPEDPDACWAYAGIVVGAPGSLDSADSDEPVELMAWLVHEVGRVDEHALWEIVDAKVFESRRHHVVLSDCIDFDDGENRVVAVSDLDAGVVHQTLDWSFTEETISVMSPEGTSCYNGAGDEIATG